MTLIWWIFADEKWAVLSVRFSGLCKNSMGIHARAGRAFI
jgi:hypothetical protein